ncbi:hypothetical protein, partial [Klenkia terrae]
MLRAVLVVVLAVCSLVGVLGIPDRAPAGTPDLALAADTSTFDPGNIISDGMFFDANALTAQQVQDFIA